MTYTIYSVGDVEFLAEILNALAMVAGHGNAGRADFETMVGIGALIGVIVMGFQSIFQGAKEWQWQPTMICILVYLLCFSTSVTVVIEDSFGGEIQVVDNVPFGPAMAGSIISQIGHNINEIFETAYGTIDPNATNREFLDSLKILTKLRQKTMHETLWAAMNIAAGGGKVDLKSAIESYITECTGKKLVAKYATSTDINTKNWKEALKFESQVYYVQMTSTASGPETVTCTDGFNKIDTALSTALGNTEVQNVLARKLEIRNGVGGGPSENPITKVSGGLTALNATMVTADDFIKSSIIQPLYAKGFSTMYRNMQDPTTALSLLQAERQKAIQSGSEQNLFVKSIRPMMTVIEGFVYAITPIAAFIMMLGAKGLGLVGKYLMLMVWIQLWTPIMSIINLFIHIKGTQSMAKYHASGIDLTSLSAITQSQAELERWISVGGMMAASTPALSFMLVSGSAVAFNSLAQRVSGADHFNEKNVSPDMLTRGPVINSTTGSEVNKHGGVTDNGAAFASVTDSSALQNVMQSTDQQVSKAAAQLTKSHQQAISSDITKGQMGEIATSQAKELMASNTQAAAWGNKATENFKNEFGIKKGSEESVRGLSTLYAAGEISGAKLAESLVPHLRAAKIAKNAAKTRQSTGGKGVATGGDTRQQATSAANEALDQNEGGPSGNFLPVDIKGGRDLP